MIFQYICCDFVRYGHLDQVWTLLQALLPEFKLPDLPPEQPLDGDEGKLDPAALVSVNIKLFFVFVFSETLDSLCI